MPDDTEAKPSIHEKARYAVEELLKLTEFLTAQQKNIEDRLLEAESHAVDAEKREHGQSANVGFFAECLPYAAAIVYTGSASKDFEEARKWAEGQPHFGFADAVSILAVLTFIYLVNRGLTPPVDRAQEQQWNSIRRRVDKLLGPSETDGSSSREAN